MTNHLELNLPRIDACLFDMDGTLWDTERVTEQAIAQLLREWRLDVNSVDLLTFHGIKWSRIGQLLEDQFPALKGRDTTAQIESRFEQIQQTRPAPMIPGAVAAFRAAATALPRTTAIVTGSDGSAVEAFLDLTDLRQACATYTSADMYEHSKPHPQSYLITADRLGVEPAHCLVFEDSEAGMTAAAAAGMYCIVISGGHAQRTATGQAKAAAVIDDFNSLPDDFFSTLAD